MGVSSANYGAYRKVDVETASQGKLVVMLFNGVIQRAEEAKRQLEKNNNTHVHNNLIRAQEILGELRGALNMKAGTIAENLDRIYEYLQHLLIQANLRKDAAFIEECLAHVVPIRDTWDEAFSLAARETAAEGELPRVSPPPSGLMNLQG